MQPSAAQDTVDGEYGGWLQETPAASPSERGEDVLRDVLLRDYEQAQGELRAVRPGRLAGLVALDDWRGIVGNVIEDLQNSDDGAGASTNLYTELRAVVSERVRRERNAAGARP